MTTHLDKANGKILTALDSMRVVLCPLIKFFRMSYLFESINKKEPGHKLTKKMFTFFTENMLE